MQSNQVKILTFPIKEIQSGGKDIAEIIASLQSAKMLLQSVEILPVSSVI